MYRHILTVLLLASCELPNHTDAPGPVISFYKGINDWTNQPTFVYSDTSIKGYREKTVQVHFAAAATIKSVLMKLNDTVKYEKNFDNDNDYNHSYSIAVKPDNLPKTYVFYCRVTDYNNRSAERTITLTCVP